MLWLQSMTAVLWSLSSIALIASSKSWTWEDGFLSVYMLYFEQRPRLSTSLYVSGGNLKMLLLWTTSLPVWPLEVAPHQNYFSPIFYISSVEKIPAISWPFLEEIPGIPFLHLLGIVYLNSIIRAVDVRWPSRLGPVNHISRTKLLSSFYSSSMQEWTCGFLIGRPRRIFSRSLGIVRWSKSLALPLRSRRIDSFLCMYFFSSFAFSNFSSQDAPPIFNSLITTELTGKPFHRMHIMFLLLLFVFVLRLCHYDYHWKFSRHAPIPHLS